MLEGFQLEPGARDSPAVGNFDHNTEVHADPTTSSQASMLAKHVA